MKTEFEKKIEELNNSKVPIVTIDPSLDKYVTNTPFPQKLALAEERLKGIEIPKIGEPHSQPHK